MRLTATCCGALLLLLGTAVPAAAQDTLTEIEIEYEETEAEYSESYAAADAPSSAPTHAVWWGNRSISYGNYIRFDRIDVDAVAPARPEGPREFDTLWFDRDKAFLRPEARAIVDNAALYLRMTPDANAAIEIRVGPAEMTTHRRNVAQQRANAVRDYLVQSGVAADRIRIVGPDESVVTGPNDAIIPISAM